MMKKSRLLLLAVLLTGTALVSTAKPAAACVRDMCFEVDLYTTCCYDDHCQLWCG